MIVGGGNVAIDAARTCLRLGAKVLVAYRRDRDAMPANPQELEGAEEEGVEFLYLAAPKEIKTAKGRVAGLVVSRMELGDVDSSGRRKPIPTGRTKLLPCDTLIIAAGEQVDSEFLKVFEVKTNKDGTLKADEISLNTGRAKFFAAGDAVTGPATASEAMGLAKKAAASMDYFLTGERRFHRLFVKFAYKDEVPLSTQANGKGRPKFVPVKDRLASFLEISQGYNGEQARLEAERCLRCDVRIGR